MSHEPAPWRISSQPAQLVSTDGRVVALAIGHNSENLLANARLIAAAPELLEACRVFLDDRDASQIAGYDQAVAAVAKAEGRES